ncbi:MAG: hypothetical protein RL653_1158 [Pseudomonadota bacterium]
MKPWAWVGCGAVCVVLACERTPRVEQVGTTGDAGVTVAADAGQGPDAGPLPDAGPPPFGGPGPWPLENRTYGAADGLLESPVVGSSTDAAQNLWVVTHEALYLLRPGDARFQRFAAADGLHLPGNPAWYDDSSLGGGDRSPRIAGEAAPPGILSVAGGAAGEVFVGYAGVEEDSCEACTGDWADPYRHSGKLDRVRLRADGTLDVTRMDLVANAHGAQYWHNRTVYRLLYDHMIHPGELYVGTNHGVTLLRPDLYREPLPGEWFDTVNQEWMADHLHARVCHHAPCTAGTENQRMGEWRGLALSADGLLWTAGRWTAGAIRWEADLVRWYMRPGDEAFAYAFGDPYPQPPSSSGFVNEPVFRVPQEGDAVNLTAVAVAPDGRAWFASGPSYGTGVDAVAYGIASWDGLAFTPVDPAVLGAPERVVRDLVALPDGRLAVAFPQSGVLLWHPDTGATTWLRAGAGLPDDRVLRLELDDRVTPAALRVSTAAGLAVLRKLP